MKTLVIKLALPILMLVLTTSIAVGQALTVANDQYHLYGPNSTWNEYLQVGGNGRISTSASVVSTNGNLHLDSKTGRDIFINNYSLGNTYLNSAGGNVGIGTADPKDLLDVKGIFRITGANRNWRILSHTADGNLYFRDENNTNMVMTLGSSGNVGIGTITPGSDLTIRARGTGISFTGGGNPYYGALAFNREVKTGDIFDPTGPAFQINNGGTDTNLHFQVYSPGGTLITNDALVIGSNGKIGIGISDTKGYKLAVAGNMIAESVKVQLQGSWSDFVFAKDYKLPTLQETEKHIKDKGHLPGIPSAAEVKANGIDLGEMNARLLQKIEELTLYIIEQDKRLNEQGKQFKEQISAQQMEIEKLKKQ